MHRPSPLTRRRLLGTSIGLAGSIAAPALRAQQPTEVKVGMVAPLSGPWSRPGTLMRQGATMAIEAINADGGIRALGGAKMRLVAADAGDSADKAANAVRGMMSEHPDLIAGSGAWLSNYTLAITEVSERAGLPWFTFSFSDQITGRGFQHVFQTAPKASTFADKATPTVLDLARTKGATVKRVAAIYDNTPNPSGFVRQLREQVFPKAGLELVLDEVYSPPLSDATALIQRLRRARPDMVYLLATNTSDYKLLFEKLSELGIRKPMLGHGGTVLDPSVLSTVGPELLEGVISTAAAWPGRAHAALERDYVARTREPYLTQDTIVPYAEMFIIRAALEAAGKADRAALSAVLHERAFSEAESAGVFPGGVSYDERGLRRGETVMLVQWQGGRPALVYPEEVAASRAVWAQ